MDIGPYAAWAFASFENYLLTGAMLTVIGGALFLVALPVFEKNIAWDQVALDIVPAAATYTLIWPAGLVAIGMLMLLATICLAVVSIRWLAAKAATPSM